MSLKQQRLQIEAKRSTGVLFCVLGAIMAAVSLWVLLGDPQNIGGWLSAVTPLILIPLGVFNLVTYRRELAAFEAEHGEDAGRQDPVA
ncbi:hypothetical protein NQ156_01850 [Microbacterium sp. zg.Y625]|uniref:hypothetical protein n=1 Tax=Microbacterium jiangjiandongii TaxID=3049071 RepID=UPI00214CDCB1|nr:MULTISPECIES: hypothetical protein [unclassified Microbacterium]MCR2791802.1 hypothetical protein [Microbacterium sp. zg.Y625]MCR2816479.1 hypothetical protein [Microbacterium sp. zg.Y843]WIM24619.1 hypothetical protein QNO14_10760 [Microbacterium sp. zg-Y625]